ncbi:hypothetical protein ACT3QV_004482 [Vibrio alginolyticus]
MGKVHEMTHDGIADWCAQRLMRMGYKFAFSNMTSATHGEQPDVLGLTAYGESIVVEVKVSRSDFLADKKKPWRANPQMGMGDHRVYLAPEGLLKVDDIPYGWQLWEVYGKNAPKLRVVKGRTKEKIRHPHMKGEHYVMSTVDKNITVEELFHFKKKNKDYRNELTWLLKIVGRAQAAGIDIGQFANNYQNKGAA